MAIYYRPADRSWCVLAHAEQGSAIAKPSVSWCAFSGAICAVLGLLALRSILPANSVGSCTGIRIGDRGNLVDFFTETPLASDADVLCRSSVEQDVSCS